MQTFSTLWLGNPPGPLQKACIQSFLKPGQRFQLFAYEFYPDLPSGVIRRDAREILDENFISLTSLRRRDFAMFSDLFRYALLRVEDTIWVDADVVGIGKFTNSSGYVLGFEGPGRVNNAVLGYPIDSPLAKKMFEVASNRFNPDAPWGELGPKLLTQVVSDLGLWAHVQPEYAFYGVPMRQAWALWDPGEHDRLDARTRRSSGIHLWNEILNDSPYELKKNRPPKASFIGQLVENCGAGDFFESPAWNVNSSEFLEWKREIDPYDQRNTISMRVRDLISSMPRTLRTPTNWLAHRLRKTLRL